MLGFRLGTLDDDPGAKVQGHFMIGSKVPWVDLSDDLEIESEDGAPFPERPV